MPYWELNYHIVWAVKNRESILTPHIEPIIDELIRKKAISLGGTVFSLNGWFDHRHLVASFPPKISLAHAIGQIKGVSSAMFNSLNLPGGPIYWQREYAVFSIGKSGLANIIRYVENQKEHHGRLTTIPPLERTIDQG